MSDRGNLISSRFYDKRPERILAEFLDVIGKLEEKVEVTRQILVENDKFDAIKAFKRLDYNLDGMITP